MDKKIKQLAEQADLLWSERDGYWKAYDDSNDLERFAELVRQDEREQAEKQEPAGYLKSGHYFLLNDPIPRSELIPRKEWVGLTEDDIVDLYCQVGDETEWAIGGLKDAMPFANLVEAKLKEKNT